MTSKFLVPQVEATINAKVKYKKVGANRSENALCHCKFRPIRSVQVSLLLKSPQGETVIVNILRISPRAGIFPAGPKYSPGRLFWGGALLMDKIMAYRQLQLATEAARL